MQDDDNFYAAPSVAVSEQALDYETPIDASRGARFAAALVDGLVFWPGMIPAFFIGDGEDSAAVIALAIMMLYFVALAGVNFYLLHKDAQTIGKRLLGIKIVMADYSAQCTLGRVILLRAIPIALVGAIPFIGGFIQLGGYLAIFGQERRCLHDYIANTRVVMANTFRQSAMSNAGTW